MPTRSCALVVPLALLLAPSPAFAQRPASTFVGGAQSSSSRPISGTVVSSCVVRNGELVLLVLWRGSPGWFNAAGSSAGNGGGGGSSAGANRHETGFERVRFGGRTFLIEFDYTDGVAKLLDQQISLAETNVVLVDDVDGPGGARIVDRRRIDPSMPALFVPRMLDSDPAVIAVRRDRALVAFLQCEIPTPFPPDLNLSAADPAVVERLRAYMESAKTQACKP